MENEFRTDQNSQKYIMVLSSIHVGDVIPKCLLPGAEGERFTMEVPRSFPESFNAPVGIATFSRQPNGDWLFEDISPKDV